MPMYEFTCNNCQNEFEKLFKKSSENNQFAECPKCSSIAPKNPNPSRVSILCKNSTNKTPSLKSDESSNKNSTVAAIKTPINGTATMNNVYIKGFPIGIDAQNTKLDGENITFDNVKIGIENKNSEIDIKNINSINSKKNA